MRRQCWHKKRPDGVVKTTLLIVKVPVLLKPPYTPESTPPPPLPLLPLLVLSQNTAWYAFLCHMVGPLPSLVFGSSPWWREKSAVSFRWFTFYFYFLPSVSLLGWLIGYFYWKVLGERHAGYRIRVSAAEVLGVVCDRALPRGLPCSHMRAQGSFR